MTTNSDKIPDLLRELIYSQYKALHQAHKLAPTIFTVGWCKQIWTMVMGAVKPCPVIGITPAALEEFAQADFHFHSTKQQGISRAHLQPRIGTVRELLTPDEPLSVSELLAIWFANDRTVLCARGENKTTVPNYIPIENADGALFSGTMVAWNHGKKEREFLRELHKRGYREPEIYSERR
jgi:hypothetical protein